MRREPRDTVARMKIRLTWPQVFRAALVLGAVLGFGAYCIGVPALAASLAASSASSAVDSLSTSVGASSNAVSGVSRSSSPGGGKVAQGEYRIERTAVLADAPGRTAVDLQPTGDAAAAGAQAWQLRLPTEVAARAELQSGLLVAVRERPYGFGLWRQGVDEPFFLVVRDEWAQALQARPVTAP